MDEFQKVYNNYELLKKWIRIKIHNKSIAKYLIDNEYNRIAIYGINDICDLLAEELHQNGIEVVCGVDRNADYLIQEFPLYKPNDSIPDVDILIVAVVSYYEEIKMEMERRLSIPIVSIDSILDILS